MRRTVAAKEKQSTGEVASSATAPPTSPVRFYLASEFVIDVIVSATPARLAVGLDEPVRRSARDRRDVGQGPFASSVPLARFGDPGFEEELLIVIAAGPPQH